MKRLLSGRIIKRSILSFWDVNNSTNIKFEIIIKKASHHCELFKKKVLFLCKGLTIVFSIVKFEEIDSFGWLLTLTASPEVFPFWISNPWIINFIRTFFIGFEEIFIKSDVGFGYRVNQNLNYHLQM
jgi:hypothetical protein